MNRWEGFRWSDGVGVFKDGGFSFDMGGPVQEAVRSNQALREERANREAGLRAAGFTRSPLLRGTVNMGDVELMGLYRAMRGRTGTRGACWTEARTGVFVDEAANEEVWMDWPSHLLLAALDAMTGIPGAGVNKRDRVASALDLALPSMTGEVLATAHSLYALGSPGALAEWLLLRGTWPDNYVNPKRFLQRKRRAPIVVLR